MDTLPQPCTRIDKDVPNLRVRIDGRDWGAPTSISPTTTIKQAVHFDDAIFAIDENGKLILATENVLNAIRDENSPIQQLVVMGANKLFIIYLNKIIYYRGQYFRADPEPLYEGPILSALAGVTHFFFQTKTGFNFVGESNYGQFGGQMRNTKIESAEHLDNLQITQLYSGGWHCYGKTIENKFYGWGYNQDGRLGNNGSTHALEPVLLDHDKLGIFTLACAGWHTLGLTRRGDVYIWGINVDDNLGVIGANTFTVPHLLLKDQHAINIFTGNYASTSYVQLDNGKMFMWGKNSKQRFSESLLNRVQEPTFEKGLDCLPIRNVYVDAVGCVVVLETRKKQTGIKHRDKFVDIVVCIQQD